MTRMKARNVNREVGSALERGGGAPRCSHMRTDESGAIKAGGTGAS